MPDSEARRYRREMPTPARTALATVLVAVITLLAATTSEAQTGVHSLFIGHSFFRPFADGMPFHAAQAGIVGHTQNVVFSGGATGAPQALWENPTKSAEIKAILDDGDVELFGMTYHPDYPSSEGYENWIDYALARNPDTSFFLGLPWSTDPASTTAATYASTWLTGHATDWHDLIDYLRALYPRVEIFCIPYGQSAVELRLLFEAGNLPDVNFLIGASNDAIYTDTLGHAGDILVDLGRLVWLNAIYDVDLTTYSWNPGYSTELKAIGQAIMDAHNATYGVTAIRSSQFKLVDDDTPPIVAKKRRLKFRSTKSKNGPSGVVEPAFGGPGDPTSAGSTGGGAVLTVYKVGGSPDDVYSYVLPPALWSQTGNALLPGYKYKDGKATEGPIKKVRLAKGRLTVVGKGDGLYELAGAPQENMAVRLELGTGIELCATAPARSPASKFDSSRRFEGVKDSPPPAACPPVPQDPGYGSASKAFVARSHGLL